jgi:RNase P/RNase MRP subunit POP5
MSWNNSVEVSLVDVMKFIEKALGPPLPRWQKPILISADEQRRELIVRIPHLLVPRLKQLSNNSLHATNHEIRLRVLYVSGTLRKIKKKLSRAHVSLT